MGRVGGIAADTGGEAVTLRIICVEEHLNDADLARSAEAGLKCVAPYLADYGSEFQDDPADRPTGLPQSEAPVRAEAIADGTIDDRLRAMDAHGIDVQILSYPHYAQYADTDIAIQATLRANDRMAAIVASHPDRFGGFSVLPWQDPQAAAAELRRSSELGLAGTLLAGLPGENVFLDDARYAPVLAAAEALAVPIYLHPGPPMLPVQERYFTGFGKEVTARLSLFAWGFHHEAGLQVVRLILSGTLDRYPGLRIISGHWGEMVPFYLTRLDDTLPPAATGLSRTISRTYRDQVYVTPSGILDERHFRFVHDTVGPERIIFSIDYPYLTLTNARSWLERLPIDDATRAAIAHGNAERLLRLPGRGRADI